jgi:membrane protease YdiL (CAAX protease family)
MEVSTQLFSALGQVTVVLIFCLIYFSIHWLVILRKKNEQVSFFKYLGVQSFGNLLDRKFLLIGFILILISFLTTFLQFEFSHDLKQMLMSESSPYWKILKNGLTAQAFLSGLIYCFIMASASEEILFRGLFARRLFSSLGNLQGNIVQALIFWLMHLLILRLMTGQWISLLQLIGFFTSFGMGLLLGYANYRNNGQSIGPSWLLHGSANFTTFLTLATLYP